MNKKTDRSSYVDYLSDCSSMPVGDAQEIVFPETQDHIQQVLMECDSAKTKVTVSGAGTGVVGGRIPYSGTILATDKLNKIIGLKTNKDSELPNALVEPAVTINNLNEYLKEYGLRYLPDPTEKNAFLGGTVATNASGAQGFKYGQTRDHIAGLKLVLASGEALDIKRGQYSIDKQLKIRTANQRNIVCQIPKFNIPSIKHSAGYFLGQGTDLIDLFIGQEGTLAVISQIEVSLGKLPKEVFSVIVYFNQEEKALDFVKSLKSVSRNNADSKNTFTYIDAACIEFFDKNSLELLSTRFSDIPQGRQAAVYFEQNIFHDNFEQILNCYIEFMQSNKVADNQVLIAQNKNDRQKLEKIRYDLPVLVNEKVKNNGFSKISTDIAVADHKFVEMFKYYKASLVKHKIPYCIFGHIGENHLHVNLLPENKNDYDDAKKMYIDFVEQALKYKGTVSAEHGIGKLKREYFKLMAGESALREMAILKKTFDPGLILCPGNIFDPEIFSSL